MEEVGNTSDGRDHQLHSSAGVLIVGRSAALRARAAGYLFLTGSVLGFVSVLLFTDERANRPGMIVVLIVATVVGFAHLRFGRRLPLWAYHAPPVMGTLITCALLYLRHDHIGNGYSFYFIWVGLWSFYFLTLRAAVLQWGLIAALFGVELILSGSPARVAAEHWVLVLGTVGAAGLLVARMAGQLEHRGVQVAGLLDVSRELSDITDADSARPVVCRALLRLSGATASVLYEPNADGTALVPTSSAGVELPDKALPFVGERSMAVAAFTATGAMFASRLDTEPQANPTLLKATGMASGLWHPVIRHGQPMGVLVALWANHLDEIPDGLEDQIALLATDAATTIERADLMARLESIARTDDLTGLLNRRAWTEKLPRELALADRAGVPLAVLILDLDHFKAYNDTHGHPAGDRLLKQFAGAWTQRLRSTDLLARHGGEEFAIVLPGCELSEACGLADALRDVRPDSQTCSIGVALWDREETADDLVARADRALYDAKRLGRDRTEVASA